MRRMSPCACELFDSTRGITYNSDWYVKKPKTACFKSLSIINVNFPVSFDSSAV